MWTWTNKKGDAAAVIVPALADSWATKDFLAISLPAARGFYLDSGGLCLLWTIYYTEADDQVPQILKDRVAV